MPTQKMDGPIEPALDRAEALFVADRLLDRPKPETSRIEIADLVAFLTGMGTLSSAEINSALLRQPGLRGSFVALRDRLAILPLPAQAAASDGLIDRRRLPGGQVTLFEVDSDDLVYLSVQFDSPDFANVQMSLSLSSPEGDLLFLPLPDTNEDSAAMVILDPSIAGDADIVAALRRPATQGAFLPRGGDPS